MLTGWVSMANEGDSSDVDPTGISSFKYFGDDNDGQMSKAGSTFPIIRKTPMILLIL